MNKTWKRLLCGTMAVAMTASLMTGCGKKSSDHIGEKDKEGNITLTVLDWENEATNKAMKKAFDDYMAAHEKTTVKIMPAPVGDYTLKLGQMIASNQAPDVFQTGHNTATSFSQKGLTYDFSEYIKKEDNMESWFAPGTLAKWSFSDGKNFGLPGLLNVFGFFVNKAKLAEAGLDVPSNDWTYNDLFDYAEKLKGGKDEFGCYWKIDMFDAATIGVCNGGEPLTNEFIETKSIKIDDKTKEAALEIQKHILSGAITPVTYETTNIQDIFRQGQIPMMNYGQWQLCDFINNGADCEWEYISTPRGDARYASKFDSVGWASPHNIKSPDDVWELMKFVAGDMYKTVLLDQPVAASAQNASAESFFSTIEKGGHPQAAAAVKNMVNVEYKTMIWFFPEWKDDAKKAYDPKWIEFTEGKVGVEVFDEIEKDVNKIIADYEASKK